VTFHPHPPRFPFPSGVPIAFFSPFPGQLSSNPNSPPPSSLPSPLSPPPTPPSSGHLDPTRKGTLIKPCSGRVWPGKAETKSHGIIKYGVTQGKCGVSWKMKQGYRNLMGARVPGCHRTLHYIGRSGGREENRERQRQRQRQRDRETDCVM
jgi:hypothetical protein